MRNFLLLSGTTLSGEAASRLPFTAWGSLVGLCLAFLTGLLGAKLLTATGATRWHEGAVVTGAFVAGRVAGCADLDVWGVLLGVSIAVLTGVAGRRVLRQEARR